MKNYRTVFKRVAESVKTKGSYLITEMYRNSKGLIMYDLTISQEGKDIIVVSCNENNVILHWRLESAHRTKENFELVESVVFDITGMRIKLYQKNEYNNICCFTKGRKHIWYEYQVCYWVGLDGGENGSKTAFYMNTIKTPEPDSDLYNTICKNPPPGFVIKKTEW